MGVKSLWSLLTPVGRPVLLETVEGKIMAIDSSIWLYQFQATMRDKDGRALVNAHVLGFLRRISKLLFYGIKPVFVFDGGAPVLKKNTLRGRREKKSGAAASHTKLAEQLLAAQMRREAVNHADTSTKGKGKKPGPALDDTTVYLEDIESTAPKAPPEKQPPTPSSSKKAKFYDHDPYKLPDVDMEAAVAKATRSAAPDPRLATEDELRAFIEEMRPEDFDVTSPAFRELPTEVQYEIVGDLRLKSRQTSYARLQKMLRNAPTPMDFSKQQIKNLQQRNALTQQLLVTTDSIGSAHISIPIRIASERNKEYVLMKNEGESGGWILGIRDDGTKQKPIEIDQDDPVDVNDDSDEDMEEVPITLPAAPDPDLRDYQRSMALSAIGNRSSQNSASLRRIDRKKTEKKPLFDLEDDEERLQGISSNRRDDDEEEEDDDLLAIAIQESLESFDRGSSQNKPQFGPPPTEASSSKLPSTSSQLTKHFQKSPSPVLSDDNYEFESPSRLETALSIANAGPTRPPLFHMHSPKNQIHKFGRPTLLSSSSYAETVGRLSQSSETIHTSQSLNSATLIPKDKPVVALQDNAVILSLKSEIVQRQPTTPEKTQIDSEDDDLEEVIPPPAESNQDNGAEIQISTSRLSVEVIEFAEPIDAEFEHTLQLPIPGLTRDISSEQTRPDDFPQPSSLSRNAMETNSRDHEEINEAPLFTLSPKDDDVEIPWSRSPSPSHDLPTISSGRPNSPAHEDFDAAKEMDPDAEKGDYARFISQVKGKNIEDARRELDEEIKSLNQQRKAAMRDAEDITQQMIAQIMMMLRLFGIPYITAPMEAEAQCAELVSLGLVDGVITDDSDIFLFGAQRVFKNMFNQSKTVECFLLSDLSRDLGLERDTLIRLAYLLGSDYTEGLPGVGPVVAMELLKEFPGQDGLSKFREWWMKVQSGKDKEEDNKSKFRKQFKKKFKDLFLTEDWPNPAVRDAYYHPAVDSSEEPFKWGLPDLDALRTFFHQELGWSQLKVDEILLPIIQKINKRGQAAAVNKQSNLTEFFDMSAGSGTFAPKKRQAYTSKRLQNVVDDFRRKRGRTSSSFSSRSQSSEPEPMPAEKRAKVASKSQSRENISRSTRGRGRKMTGRAGISRSRKRVSEEVHSSDDFDAPDATDEVLIPPDTEVTARLRPRPKIKQKVTQETTLDEGSGMETL
ncbi:hypothetical protein C0992_008509 [Termitomyces sp. T32_za158]|nr:hypothetical protein C0992_008509 [Termitomyces sp. T32_za158]